MIMTMMVPMMPMMMMHVDERREIYCLPKTKNQ